MKTALFVSVWFMASVFSSSPVSAAGKKPPTNASKDQAANQDTGPSLKTTLDFIAAKLREQGEFNFVTTGADYHHTVSERLNDISADPRTCDISWHLHRSTDVSITTDMPDARINFGWRMKKLVVLSANDELNEINASMNFPKFGAQSVEPVFFVVAIRKADGESDYLKFHDREDADRTAKAMIHAIELCGGGSADPF